MKYISKIILIGGFLSLLMIVFYSMSSAQKMVVVMTGNMDAKPLEIQLGHFQDSDCGMVIDSIEYASQVISKDGKTWFFHDHGGMAKWLSDKSFKDMAVIWVWAKDSKKWIDGRKAWYSQTDKTPMNYGFGAYEQRGVGNISFDEMTLKMLRGENLTNPYIAKMLGVK